MSARDTVNIYLQEIARYPILEADDEITLGKQVQRMISCLETKNQLEKEACIILDHQDWAKAVNLSEKQLTQVLRQGKIAKDKMIRSNLRLVISVAKKYLKRDLEFLDLIQEGNIGLERAVEKFDPTKGYKFSTYAYWWIRQSITRAIYQQSRTIRLPIHVTEQLNKIKKAQRELSQKLGRSATTAEVAAEMGITPDKVRKYLYVGRTPMSLDVKVGHEQDSTLSDLIEDKTAVPNEDIDQILMKEEVRQILAGLNPREREVIAFRFGLVDGQEWSLTAIGKRFNIGRERVRQLESKALKKLRKNKPLALREYLAG